MEEFYTIPFNPLAFFQQEPKALKCDLETSIKQHLSLIITTRFGEYRFDPEFGCRVWDIDFITPGSLEKWKEDIENRLSIAIIHHEHRIKDITKFVVELQSIKNKKHNRICQKLHIEIKMSIKGTEQMITFSESLFFSPYSIA